MKLQFLPMKLQFLTYGTLVSHLWNFSFTQVALTVSSFLQGDK